MRYLLPLCLIASGAAGPSGFSNVSSMAGIDFQFEASKTSAKYLIESMGGGVAFLDADNDGRLDLFFTNGAALRPGMSATDAALKSHAKFWNRLFRNKGDGSFSDITEKAGLRGEGYSQGVATGDCDNDGRTDLVVTALAGLQLYRNRGGAEFEDFTARSGLKAEGWLTSAGFFDYDRDGNLDLFVARYLRWDFSKNKRCGGEGPALQAYCHPNEFEAVPHLLFRGLGGCRFEDVSQKAGIAKHPGKGLGVAFTDFDEDGFPDVLVANDSFPQQVFRNKGDGRFGEQALELGAAYDEDGKVFAGMGIDAADYDNDGHFDFFVNALANQGYGLFRNGKPLFEYVSASSGITAASKMHSGWGTKFFDFDNDGWKDIFVAQGHVMDNIELTQPGTQYRESPLLLRNVKGQFREVGKESFALPEAKLAARGAAFGDWNNDGAIDVAVAVVEGKARLLRNDHAGNHWIQIDPVGTKSNRDGLGARVRIVTPKGKQQSGYVSTAGSYLSAHDKRVHFGLGEESSISLLEIYWPSGAKQIWKDLRVDQVFRAMEGKP